MVATMKLDGSADLAAVLARLDQVSAKVDAIAAAQRRGGELYDEFAPILKEVMGVATEKLDRLEQRGAFAFGRELAGVGRRVLEGYGAEDVRQLGDAVVGILDVVRAFTQPELLNMMGEISQVLRQADEAQPIGLLGTVRATRDHEVQKGLAVILDLVRRIGRTADAVAARRAGNGSLASKRAKLDAITGRRATIGPERRLPAPARAAAPAPAPRAPACGATAAAPPTARVVDGVAFTAEGYLADASAWTRALGQQLAAAEGIQLGGEHWRLIEWARGDFDTSRVSPNIRRITQGMGITTKDVYALFPKAPGRTLAKIAGLPKPAGCL